MRFFRMPFDVMDRVWFAMENGISAEEAAVVLEMETESVERAYTNLSRKISATAYLRTPPIDYAEDQ